MIHAVKRRHLLFFSFFLSFLAILSSPAVQADDEKVYQTIEWIELLPADDLQALMNPPEYIAGIADGSAADSVDAFKKKDSLDETATRFQNALKSARIVDTYKDQSIRIPGFIVPLDYREDQTVISFFIVPYFGACLHMPPPPPNQMIYGQFEQGVELQELSSAFWFEGTLQTSIHENYMGTSAYELNLDKVLPYDG